MCLLTFTNRLGQDRQPSSSVNLKWMCKHGKEQHKTFYHLPGRVVQHEMDHLNGKLIID